MAARAGVPRPAPHAVLRRLYKDVYTLEEALENLSEGNAAETALRERLAMTHPTPEYAALLHGTFVAFDEHRPEVRWDLVFSTRMSQDLVSDTAGGPLVGGPKNAPKVLRAYCPNHRPTAVKQRRLHRNL